MEINLVGKALWENPFLKLPIIVISIPALSVQNNKKEQGDCHRILKIDFRV